MMERLLIVLGLILWIVMFISPNVHAQVNCPTRWFGSDCQYRCHCTNDCDNNGDCAAVDTCEKGWFGPQCQYVDLTYTQNDGTTKPVFIDADDTTCNDDIYQGSGTLTLRRKFPITWLRLHFNTTVVLQNINVYFGDSDSDRSTILCNNQRIAVVDSRTIDIHCNVGVEVNKVYYTGVAVGYLCSIYVSGGRNVALKQRQVNQSGTYSENGYYFGPSNAVDGNTNQDFTNRSCTHTLGGDAYWNVQFAQISDINRYKLYNRVYHPVRLKGFVLTSFDKDGHQVFQHIDSLQAPQPVYDFTTATNTSSINRVNIIATNTEDGHILTLCEVEIYGDSHCPVGKYGRECDQDCHCTSNEPCFVSTGQCPSGCAAGYIGEHCDQPCQSGTYGPNCATPCSTNCQDPLRCNYISGKCEECVWGKQGDLCDSNCPPTKYGPRCIHECSTNCHNQQCEGTTDRCVQCPPGKNGTLCDKDCPPTHYGQRCVSTCSPNCVGGRCNGTSGRCIDCPPGKTGDNCTLNCPPFMYGPRCINSCSMNCLNNKCNGTSGICDECPPGRLGQLCDTDCPTGLYGKECKLPCSANCKEGCDPMNGICKNGCIDGFMGDDCTSACGVDKYGAGCLSNCSEFCNTTGLTDRQTSCHNVHGTCLYGCDDKHQGSLCAEQLTSAGGSDDSARVATIVGAIVGVLLAIVVVVLGVLYWRRRRSKQGEGSSSMLGRKDRKEQSSSRTAENNPYKESGPDRSDNPYHNVEIDNGSGLVNIAASTERSQSAKTEPKPPAKPKQDKDDSKSGKKGEKSDPYYNTTNISKPQSTTIAIGDLQAFVAANNKSFFKKQFESIHENKSATTKVGQSAENKPKNRYKNICAYDHSRVTLETGNHGEHGDYINASYIEGYKGEEKFIASQGPTKLIMDDFIRMLWEQKTEKVVMLTNLVEEGKMKCEKYWPDDDKRHFADIKMVLATTEVFADYTIRRLKLCKKGYPDQVLTHFHFTSWPDKGVPTIPWGLVDFEQRVASYPTDSPIVVHCSAGVGRTGTFIALRNVMRQAEDTGYVDCFATVQKLRNDRINMVQTAEQYEFLHRAAQVAMVCLGTTVTSGDIQERIAKLQSKSKSRQTHMEEEFKAICSVCADAAEPSVKQDPKADSGNVVYENSGHVANKLKDRLKNVPPKEQYRATLACENDDMGEYINAVLVPSFRKLDQQLLTQLPLPTTVTDFWRLVTQYKVSLVVALKLDCDDRDQSIADYLPPNEGNTTSIPLFNIESGAISRGEVAEVQELTVKAVDVDMRRKSMPVFLSGHHRMTHVTYMGTDLNPKKLLALIKVLREHFPGPEGRVIFMCRNGATCSGLVCVLTLLLDRMDHDLRLTVPLVVGAIKSIRPQVIPTLDQYKLLYDILHTYNESANVYSNFGEAQSPDNEQRSVKEHHKENSDIYYNS